MGQSSGWWHQHAVWSPPCPRRLRPRELPYQGNGDPSRRLRHKPEHHGLGPPSMGEAAGGTQGTPPAHRPPALAPAISGPQSWPASLEPGRQACILLVEGRPGGKRRQTASFVHTFHICPPRACPGGLPPASPLVRRWDAAGVPCGAVAKLHLSCFLCPVLCQPQAPGGETLRRGQPGLQLT